jgi:hypothetical protein
MTQKPFNSPLPYNGQSIRANHLDWLRFLIVFLLIPYHAAMMFHGNILGWINNPLSNPAALAFCQILDQFQMPLLFTIAGIAAWFSLGSRTGKQYIVERVERLFVPIVFGILVFNALVSCISVLFHNQISLYNNSFLVWYRTYLTTMLLPWQKNWSPGIFWFIWYLFIYSTVLLPMLIFLRKRISPDVWVKIGEYFEKRGIFLLLFLLAILPVLVQLYPPPNFYSNFQISYFLFFFVYGFFIYSSQQMQRCIFKFGLIALIIGIISITLVMLLIFPNPADAPLGLIYWRVLGSKPNTFGQDLYMLLRGISCWFSIIGLIYLARKLVNFSNRFLRYANEAVLPFYLMHAALIVVIGYYVIPLNVSIIEKFVVIAVSTLGTTLAAFEIFKRFNITRFLLGMRLKKAR